MRAAGAIVGMALLLSACTDAESTAPEPVDESYVVAGELSCDSEVKEAPTLPLPEEPVAMLVCGDPESMVPWTAPADVVEQHLGRLVDAIEDLEPVPDEPFDCTFDGGVAFHLLLRLAQDRAVRVKGDTGGCSVVESAGQRWLGSDDFFQTVLELVEEQRRGMPPPVSLPPALREAPSCPDSGTWPPYSLVGEARDLLVAVSCWRPDAKELPPFGPAVTVPRRDLGFLLRDLEQNTAPSKVVGAGYDCPGGLKNLYTQTLVGRTVWGDLVAVDGWCHEFHVRPPWTQSDGDPLLWHPSPRAQRILDRLRH